LEEEECTGARGFGSNGWGMVSCCGMEQFLKWASKACMRYEKFELGKNDPLPCMMLLSLCNVLNGVNSMKQDSRNTKRKYADLSRLEIARFYTTIR